MSKFVRISFISHFNSLSPDGIIVMAKHDLSLCAGRPLGNLKMPVTALLLAVPDDRFTEDDPSSERSLTFI